MATKTIQLEPGKCYCIGFKGPNGEADKRVLLYQGPEKPAQDLCSGELTQIDPGCIAETVEVPSLVVDAIKLANNKKQLPKELPVNVKETGSLDKWEADVYWDD